MVAVEGHIVGQLIDGLTDDNSAIGILVMEFSFSFTRGDYRLKSIYNFYK